MSEDLLSCILVSLKKGRERPCLILHGGIGAGKTQTAAKLSSDLKERGIKVGGVLSPRITKGDETIGYAIRDLSTDERRPFARLTPPGIAIGRFYLSPASLSFARAAIEQAATTAQVVFVDEVGRLELGGEGHAQAIRVLLRSQALSILLVRSAFVERVVKAFGIAHYTILPVESGAPAISNEEGGDC